MVEFRKEFRSKRLKYFRRKDYTTSNTRVNKKRECLNRNTSWKTANS